MSSSDTVTSRLDYLAQAAEALSRTSPAVSGHLRSSRRRLATGAGKAIPIPGHLQICSACGSSLVPGWNCEMAARNPHKKRTRQDRLRKQDTSRVIDVRCSRCDSLTKFEVVKPTVSKERPSEIRLHEKLPPAKPSRSQPLEPPKPVISRTAPVPSAAKKRSRNKKSSLQSMLESRKETPQTQGFGLDLADFMM